MTTVTSSTRDHRKQHQERRRKTSDVENATTSNQNLYDQLYSAIQTAYLSDFIGGNGQLLPTWQFQFPNPAAQSPAVWVETANNNFQPYQMFEAGDLAPISKQGSYVTDSSCPSIFENYGLWLGAVLPANLGSNQQYIDDQNLANEYAQDMQDAVNGAGPSFATWLQQNPGSTITTVTQWLTQVPALAAAQPYATNYQTALANYNNEITALQTIANNLNKPLATAQQNYQDTAYQTQYATAAGVDVTMGTTIVGNLDGTLNPVNDWVAWSTGQSNPDLTPFQATVASGVVPVTTVETVVFEATEQFSFFFGLFSVTLEQQMTFFVDITTDQNFSLIMNWASLVMYPISRELWYGQSFLQENANDTLASTNQVDFFGPENGTLYLVPSFVFLGWNPSLTLTLTTTLYNTWQSQISSSEGVYLNGITVPGPPTSVTNNPDGTTTVNYGTPTSPTSMAQLPSIVGYVHFVPTTQGTD